MEDIGKHVEQLVFYDSADGQIPSICTVDEKIPLTPLPPPNEVRSKLFLGLGFAFPRQNLQNQVQEPRGKNPPSFVKIRLQDTELWPQNWGDSLSMVIYRYSKT